MASWKATRILLPEIDTSNTSLSYSHSRGLYYHSVVVFEYFLYQTMPCLRWLTQRVGRNFEQRHFTTEAQSAMHASPSHRVHAGFCMMQLWFASRQCVYPAYLIYVPHKHQGRSPSYCPKHQEEAKAHNAHVSKEEASLHEA